MTQLLHGVTGKESYHSTPVHHATTSVCKLYVLIAVSDLISSCDESRAEAAMLLVSSS
jgi:hypothetical protein